MREWFLQRWRRVARGVAWRLGFMPIPAPPAVPSPPLAWTGRPGGPIAAIDMDSCFVFFGYARIHAYAVVDAAEQFGADALRAGVRVALELDGADVAVQRHRILSVQPSLAVEFELDALVARDFPIERAFLLIWFEHGLSRFPLQAVLPYARARDLRTQFTAFMAIVAACAEAEARTPSLLDIGGRARRQVQKGDDFPHCTVTVFDIVADEGVDVVGDAHELSRHFPPEHFDFAMSLAVFEHLLMPWKVAVELNRVLKPGGMCYIWAPQTHALHDLPWDFLRFSDQAWAGLFNRYTGFEIVATDMSHQMHIVAAVHPEQSVEAEDAAGFMSCGVIARKIGPPLVDWPVPLGEVLATCYPSNRIGDGKRHVGG